MQCACSTVASEHSLSCPTAGGHPDIKILSSLRNWILTHRANNRNLEVAVIRPSHGTLLLLTGDRDELFDRESERLTADATNSSTTAARNCRCVDTARAQLLRWREVRAAATVD